MLKTEMRNERTMNLHRMETMDMLSVFSDENFNAVRAVEKALPSIGKAIDEISSRMKNGGRLLFIGAGTSGRLGVLDASECPPTFGVSPELVVGIIAGGEKCMFCASENAEDIAENGRKDVLEKGICEKDSLIGISVAGGAAYVVEALKAAKENGAVTIALTCNENSPIAQVADIEILTDTGAEVLTGSSRLKAGTAHKMVLNMISTCCMAKLGYVYENMMINLKPTNIKLKDRMIRILCDILNCDRERSEKLLNENEWSLRKAAESVKGELI